jgi:hypothetical protein
MLDEYLIEIDESYRHCVVLVVPALHLLVRGRTLHEAQALAKRRSRFDARNEAGTSLCAR